MRRQRFVLALVLGAGLLGVGGGIGCSPADTNEKIEISGTAPGSDVPQTQEEYMKRQAETQAKAYSQAGTAKKR